MHTTDDQTDHHVPVLLNAVLEYLNPQTGETYLDLTAGYGGHAGAILERTENLGDAVLVDRDQNAINALSGFEKQHATLLHTDFLAATLQLRQAGRQFDMILADLGVSSPHLDSPSRGFAFAQDGPLDMRMDQRAELTAKQVVNKYAESEIASILKAYGEEPRANRIAHAIVQARPIESTAQLALIVRAAVPGHSKTHPATRTFQALRIAVNDELGMLEQALPMWFDLLAPGGRLGVISFHSLEDRIVKQAFKDRAGDRYDATMQLLTKRPVTASQQELVSNPRSRSAKLRAAVKK